MSFRKNKEKTKICPRCGLKVQEFVAECPDCGLVFSRLDIATNKEAKRKKLRGDRDYIIKTTKLPSDVSFIKLLLLCIFLGPFGAHNFYVGRYLKGSVLLTDFIALILMVVFNSQLIELGGESLVGTISTILGMIMLMWFWDLFMIIVRKYKIPVAIDIDFDLENLGENNDIYKENASDENINKDNAENIVENKNIVFEDDNQKKDEVKK